jgi:hypothetical protein
MSMTLAQTNGSKPHAETRPWLQKTVRQFFSNFNWEDQPPEVQEIRTAFQADASEPLSLKLTVKQFFGAINWEGNAIAASNAASPTPELTFTDDISEIKLDGDNDGFTLDDFSGLF